MKMLNILFRFSRQPEKKSPNEGKMLQCSIIILTWQTQYCQHHTVRTERFAKAQR